MTSHYEPVPAEIGNFRVGLDRTPLFGLFPDDRTTRHVRPATVMQALMEQAPGDNLDESLEECQPIRDAIHLAQSALTAEEVFILEAVAAEGLSRAELGVRLGCPTTTAHRMYVRALDRLRSLLLNNRTIRERLNMPDTWNAAALDALTEIAGFDEGWPPSVLLDRGDTVADIVYAIAEAVDALHDDREKHVVDCLTHAAEHAVLYLRSVNQWKLLDMHDLLVSKQHDYGHDNILAFGMTGVVVRSSDKSARLLNVSSRTGVQPRNETLIDTFYDVIGYAVIARMLKAETFELELDNTTEAA